MQYNKGFLNNHAYTLSKLHSLEGTAVTVNAEILTNPLYFTPASDDIDEMVEADDLPTAGSATDPILISFTVLLKNCN